MSHYTRFRTYQLGQKGASFSLYVEKNGAKDFTLIEARYNDKNKEHVKWEMSTCGVTHINTLHITSWDEDHCSPKELDEILNELRPDVIEYPSYTPHTQSGADSLKKIVNYKGSKIPVTPILIEKQDFVPLRGVDLFYNPRNIDKDVKSNDKAVVKFFRRGSFQILSLGDCESSEIANALASDDILSDEVDIMLLAHHGADNGFTTDKFIKAIKPKVAISASDWGNQYEHPRQEVRNILSSNNVKLYTTKAGDVIAQTIDKHSFKVSNYISNNESKESTQTFGNKTSYIND